MKVSEAEALHWLKLAQNRRLTQREAAERIGISERWLRSLLQRMKTRGDRVLTHGLRGRPSNRRIRQDVRGRVLELMRGEYKDFGPTLAAAYLKEQRGLAVSKETLRQWMIQEGLWQPAQFKKVPVTSWTPRRKRDGDLVHWYVAESAWAGEANPSIRYLIGMISDATSRAVARFSALDSPEDHVALLGECFKQWGRPKEFRLGRIRITGKEPELLASASARPSATVQRVMRRLDIAWSAAHPPPSGRVEHFFGSAARGLVERLRRNHASSLEEANSYLVRFWLPSWNRRQTVQPAVPEDAFRPLPGSVDEALGLDA